jgi:MoxR-like ATPase
MPDSSVFDPAPARAFFDAVAANISRVMHGQRSAIRKLLAVFAAGGHALLEDAPGTGKTTLAKAFARSLDARFTRVQFTPDLLPSDILGVSIYEQHERVFRFHEGPVFTDILLGDELNRASPRTQSALLEAMAENQVSLEGARRQLSPLFFVIATQNPLEHHGTYPLPESQLDRFAMRFSLGYVQPEEEVAILTAQSARHPLETLSACATREQALQARAAVTQVRVSPELTRYIVDLAAGTRKAAGVRLGASPRGALLLMKCSQALALMDGLDYLTPEQVHEAAIPVLAHRLSLDEGARYAGGDGARVVQSVLDSTPTPV